MNSVINAISWLPPEWTVPILIAKGVLALSGVLLLVFHMDRCWDSMANPAQRARYILLLGFGVLQTGGTAEMLNEGVQISYRHLGSLICAAGLVVVAVWSIRAEHLCPELTSDRATRLRR